ncbi:hypothetical protein EON81_04135 [bacterium]|nr:MAG: hypothetical protein EON81_04135 [bacterium]
MEVQPLFEGQEITYGYMPLRVELANDGNPAQGMIVVSGQGQKTVYPVDLPTGARKIVPIYVNLGWGAGNVVLRTNQGSLTKDVQVSGGYEQSTQNVLMITQSPGELAGLRSIGGNKGSSLVRDTYVRPAEAPDRPLAYVGVAAVLLGEGSERLSDDVVKALRDYVLMGGTVVMFGGASAPVLSDTRWSDLAPVKDGRVETVSKITVSNTELEGPLSLVRASARAGAIVKDRDGSIPTIVERPVGLGRTLFVAVNPTETQATGQEVATMIYRSLRISEGTRGRAVLTTYSGGGELASSGGPSNASNDPFTAQLPSFDTIALILGAFFVVVIPANFLILRLVKRGEWAWFTAPVISLGFAALLFSKASDLYAAKTSTYSGGALVAQQGSSDAWFVGQTSFFIPSGGTYDLKLKDIDSLGNIAAESDGYGYRPQPDQPEFEAVDDGRNLIVPALRANNLAFRSLAYRQEIPDAGKWFSIDAKGTPGSDFVTFQVRNNSPHNLSYATVMLGENQIQLGDIKAGGVKSGQGAYIKETIRTNATRKGVPAGAPPPVVGGPTQEQGSVGSLTSLSWRTRRPILTGFVRGLRPGPQIGTDMKDRTSIRLLFMGDVR